MNLTELARLAAEANAIQDQDWHKPLWKDHYAFTNSCTPERIAALVRVAEASLAFHDCLGGYLWQHDCVESDAAELRMRFAEAMRDLEATP